MKKQIVIGFTFVLLLTACVGSVVEVKERQVLSDKMVNLSSAVDSYFSDLAEAPIDSEINIIRSATRRDPRLFGPEFQPYLLKVQFQNPYAVLLLCSKDGSQAIMEDAGCSTRLDRQVNQAAPCEFTLHVTQNCRVEGADTL
ncbi:MAG: hypothetical protein ACXWF8_09740 [Methylobacter sp.]